MRLTGSPNIPQCICSSWQYRRKPIALPGRFARNWQLLWPPHQYQQSGSTLVFFLLRHVLNMDKDPRVYFLMRAGSKCWSYGQQDGRQELCLPNYWLHHCELLVLPALCYQMMRCLFLHCASAKSLHREKVCHTRYVILGIYSHQITSSNFPEQIRVLQFNCVLPRSMITRNVDAVWSSLSVLLHDRHLSLSLVVHSKNGVTKCLLNTLSIIKSIEINFKVVETDISSVC